MFRARRLLLTGVPLVLLIAPASAQRDDSPDTPARATEIPSAGFWPTDLMLERLLDRGAEALGDEYGFDDEQIALTQELLKERIPSWLKANRAEIQTLINQFYEAQLHDEPPSVEAVAQWAQRALPLFNEFTDEVLVGITDDMRNYMTDEQTDKLDVELAAFETGVTLVTNKLSVWAGGGYDPESEWHAFGAERERARQREADRFERETEAVRAAALEKAAERDAPATDGERAAATAPAEPPDEWTTYTLAFIERYQLTHDQRQKAMEFLRASREQRDRYLRGAAGELERVQKLLADAQGEAQRAAALAEFEKLNAPVARRFQQLKDKLDTLPTRAQRRAAAEADRRAEAQSDRRAENQSERRTAGQPDGRAAGQPDERAAGQPDERGNRSADYSADNSAGTDSRGTPAPRGPASDGGTSSTPDRD